MIMCIKNLVLIGLFVFKILSKNSILTLIKGFNSIANLPKFEFIQAFMHVLVTCKNEEDQIENEGASRALDKLLFRMSTVLVHLKKKGVTRNFNEYSLNAINNVLHL